MPTIHHHGSSGLLLSIALTTGTALAEDESPTRVLGAATGARAQAVLDERASRAQVWQYTWGGIGYAMSASFVTLAITTDDKDQRLDFAFAGAGIFIDTTMHMIDSIEPHAAAHARQHPENATAEWKAAAEAEDKRRSLVYGHLMPAGFATLGGLVLWLGFDHIEGAVASVAAAVVTNELRILTQPTSARDAWNDSVKQPAVGAAAAASPSYRLLFWGTGLGVGGSF